MPPASACTPILWDFCDGRRRPGDQGRTVPGPGKRARPREDSVPMVALVPAEVRPDTLVPTGSNGGLASADAVSAATRSSARVSSMRRTISSHRSLRVMAALLFFTNIGQRSGWLKDPAESNP